MNPFEISLYGNIGDSIFAEGNGSKSVIDQVKQAAATGSPIDLHINSPGGSVFEGYTIYNAAGPQAGAVYIDGQLPASPHVAMAGALSNGANAML
jgi:ATP-dependent protease ClpP protease subunit